MAEVQIPIGSHFFTPQALQKALDKIPSTDLGPNRHGAALAMLDAEGATVALSFTSTDGKWRVRGAYSYDWNGDKMMAGDILYKF